MKVFFITIFSGLLIVISINLYVDPAFTWHRSHLSKDKPIGPNDCIDLLPVEDDRIFRRELLVQKSKADIIFLGSSRIGHIEAQMFKGNQNFLNIFFSIGLLEDYISVWQNLKMTNKIPEKIFFMIDPWLFNIDHYSYRAWSSLPDFKSFLVDQKIDYNLSKPLYRKHIKHRLMRSWDRLMALISWNLTRKSFFKILSHEQTSLPVRSCDQLNMTTGTFVTNDGHYIILDQYDSKEVLQSVAKDKTPLYISKSWELDKGIEVAYEKWLLDMKRNGVKVYLITPIWHPLTYEILKNEPFSLHYQSLIQRTQNENLAHVCEVYKARDVGCSKEDFRDIYHFNRECTWKLLEYCARKNVHFKDMIQSRQL